VILNPVRAGLVADAREYPHIGASGYDITTLLSRARSGRRVGNERHSWRAGLKSRPYVRVFATRECREVRFLKRPSNGNPVR
jgi:hypothetical protein